MTVRINICGIRSVRKYTIQKPSAQKPQPRLFCVTLLWSVDRQIRYPWSIPCVIVPLIRLGGIREVNIQSRLVQHLICSISALSQPSLAISLIHNPYPLGPHMRLIFSCVIYPHSPIFVSRNLSDLNELGRKLARVERICLERM